MQSDNTTRTNSHQYDFLPDPPFFPDDIENYPPWVAWHGLVAPFGRCQCGCGALAPIAAGNNARYGTTQGLAQRYIAHHHRRSTPIRFWAQVAIGEPDQCWDYLGCVDRQGYGKARWCGGYWQAHRLAWTLSRGLIPDGLHVLHICDNPPCCNSAHLFLGTNADNIADMVTKGRQAHGEGHYRAKLTKGEVAEIVFWCEIGYPRSEIADMYNVTSASISAILRGKSWGHLTGIPKRKRI